MIEKKIWQVFGNGGAFDQARPSLYQDRFSNKHCFLGLSYKGRVRMDRPKALSSNSKKVLPKRSGPCGPLPVS
jgi:hypothetical protein